MGEMDYSFAGKTRPPSDKPTCVTLKTTVSKLDWMDSTAFDTDTAYKVVAYDSSNKVVSETAWKKPS